MVAPSPGAVPALPANVGAALFVKLPPRGCDSVTTGAVVSMVNVLAPLVPTLPAESACWATAVYLPSASGGKAATDQLPEPTVAVRTSTGLPVAVPPA